MNELLLDFADCTALENGASAAAPRRDDAVHFRRCLEDALGVPFAAGNRIEALENGEQIFAAMLQAIRSARKRVVFVTYVFWKGDIAESFAEAFAERAAAGVEVYVLLDAFGAHPMSRTVERRMVEASVRLRWFRRLATWRLWRNDKRTHRKILLVDGETGFTGGVGIAREWSGDARDPQEWRDTHFRIEGPAVHGLNAAFVDNWQEAGEWTSFVPVGRPTCRENGVPMQVVRASSTVEWSEVATLVRTLIENARRSLRIVTPYFSPDTTTVALLCAAAQRGVSVQILTSGQHCDMIWSQRAGQRHYDALLDSGVEIFLYQKTHLHSKLMLADGIVSCIGSANLNHRSLGKDEECCVNVLDPVLTAKLQAQFRIDLAAAERIDPQRWPRRSAFVRATEKLAALFVEQL